MQTISVDRIIVPPDGQRQKFDEDLLRDLAESMTDAVGLMHAITLRQDGKTIVAGRRRVRALATYIAPFGKKLIYNGEELPVGHIPYAIAGTDDALALEEAELAENAKREDLTWQENVAATARLHALRQKQLNRLAAEIGVMPVQQTVAATATEIHGRADGQYHNNTKVNIILSAHLDNPEVAKAKSAKDAFKILVRQEETRKHSALAAAVGKVFNARMHEAHHVNCIEWMARAENKDRFDVILTDPPYGMGADKFGDAAGKLATIEHEYDDSYENWALLMSGYDAETKTKVHEGWCNLAFRVAKPQAHAYVFCDFDRFHELKGYMIEAGWYVFRTPIINVKGDGRVPLPDKGPRRVYELCLYAIKGDKYTTGIYPDVIHSSADEQMGHGAQKPVSLYIDLLKRSARPGDTVLDSCSGSGTIFPAAHACKVKAVGLDQSQSSYGKGLERLAKIEAEERAQPSLEGVV